MKIIENEIEIEELVNELSEKKSKNKDLKINRFLIQGDIQKHHRKIIKDFKKVSDILIVEFNELFDYLAFAIYDKGYPKRPTYLDIKYSSKNINDIDYLIINKLPNEKILKFIQKKIKIDFPIIRKECNRLNLSSRIAIESFYGHVINNPLRNLIKDKFGPKSIIQMLLHIKCFKSLYKNYPDISFEELLNDCDWILYKDSDGYVCNRRGKALYEFLRIKVYDLLMLGETRFEGFKNVARHGLLPDYHFTLLDLLTMEKIDKITDNCGFIFSSFAGMNFIFIRNGEVIF